MHYEVVKEHRSNYPHPINLGKGDSVIVGERYAGAEGWNNWVFCTKLDHSAQGWVPEQLLQRDGELGVLTTDYTAKELNVDIGDEVVGSKEMNGWMWCEKLDDHATGWVPKEKLQKLSTMGSA